MDILMKEIMKKFVIKRRKRKMNKLVIYYDTNSWGFYKIGIYRRYKSGKIKNILEKGNVTVALSLERT